MPKFGGRPKGDGSHAFWRRCREHGQSLVIVAVTLVGLIAFLALVVDLGNVFTQRRFMQGAADAAALAGARRLALNLPYDAIESDVREYACDRNGADTYGLQVNTESIAVSVSKVCQLYFAPVIGIREMPVVAASEAGYGYPGSWKGDLMPIAVQSDTLAFACLDDCIVDIWDDSTVPTDPADGIIGDGQRGWLNFNGGPVGTDELCTWVVDGYNEKVSVGDWINGTPGTKTKPLQVLAQVRLHQLVTVPVYEETRAGVEGSGQLDYHIVAFAQFEVLYVMDTMCPKYVEGKFRRWVAAQESGGTVDTGVRVIGLK